MSSNAKQWVESLMGDDSGRSVSEAIGVAQATLARQIKEGNFQPEVIIKLSRHYGRSPLEGLQAMGLLTEVDVAHMRVRLALRAATDDELVGEVLRRLKETPESDLSVPISDLG